MITAPINAIIKKRLDFQNNHGILLILYYRDIGPKIKDIDMIILASEIIYNMEYYR